MICASLVSTTDELQQILKLQQQNLIENIELDEIRSQGFVTVRHDLPKLQLMHELGPSVVIKDDEQVVAYALTMLTECCDLIPELKPMFALLDHLSWNNRPLCDHQFYVMGQVCVAKPYRGMGLFEQLYLYHKKIYSCRFELFVTEVAARNHRSLRAHEKIGFKTIHTYRDHLDEWVVMAWDWS